MKIIFGNEDERNGFIKSIDDARQILCYKYDDHSDIETRAYWAYLTLAQVRGFAEIAPVDPDVNKRTTPPPTTSGSTPAQEHAERTPDLAMFESIQKAMHDTYVKKNHDYGNSFSDTWNEFGRKGIVTAAAQISHKYNRFKNIVNGAEPMVSETIDDTLMDMANYCILTMIELQKKRGKEDTI